MQFTLLFYIYIIQVYAILQFRQPYISIFICQLQDPNQWPQ